MRTTYTINAENKKLGRIASEAAKVLMGKNSVSYQPNIVTDVEVHITNASKMRKFIKDILDIQEVLLKQHFFDL